MQRFTVTGTLLTKLALALMLALSIASCSTTRVHTSAVRDSIVMVHDTIFTARLQYDSTFHDHYHSVIAIDSIVYVRDSVVLYKYKLKHDSVFIHKTDTVYIKRNITMTKEVPRKRNWFDYTSYSALAILIVLLAWKIKKTLTL